MGARKQQQNRVGAPSFQKVGECLYRNPSSGTYYALLKISGKQIKRKLRASDLPEAKRQLRDFREEQGRIDPAKGRITVDGICDEYAPVAARHAPRTARRKADILKRIRERWKGTQARQVKKADVVSWLASFDFGPPSFNLHLQEVRALFRFALDGAMVARNPADGIKQKKRLKPKRHTPTAEEFRAIVESIRTQKFSDTAGESADYVEFMGLAGLGQAEAAALTWRDVDFARGQMSVVRRKTGQEFHVPIFPQLLPLLEKRLTAATLANDGRPPAPGASVFGIRDAKRAIDAACTRLGLTHYASRSFRRHFITSAIERGVDVKVIAQWQGHRDGGKLILDTYSHVRPAHSEQMAKLMTTEKIIDETRKEICT